MSREKGSNPDKDNQLFDFLKNNLSAVFQSEINCHMIGRIIKYDKSSHHADVVPLPLQSDDDIRATLIDCIVPQSIYGHDELIEKLNPVLEKYKLTKEKKLLKIGSIVWVGFCDRELDNYHGKSNYPIDTKRMHSLNDVVIESVIKS